MRRATLQEDTLGAAARPASAGRPAVRLRASNVHVWEIRLDQPAADEIAYLRDLLSPDEEERADSFYFERDRRRFVAGRGVLRAVLGRYLDCRPRDITFRYGANGKPELALPGGEALHFNLAHSEDMALCAITRSGPVGVDIERIRELPDWQYIATTCFSPAERRRVETAPPPDRRVEFFRAWTRQEAVLKATGVGLGGVAPHNDAAATADGANPAFRAGVSALLRVYPLSIHNDFAAAVAVSRGAQWLTWFGWDPSLRHGDRPLTQRRRLRLDQAAQLNLHVT